MTDCITEAVDRLLDLHAGSPYGTAQVSSSPEVHPDRAQTSHQQWRNHQARRTA